MFELNNLNNKFLAMRNLLSLLATLIILSGCSTSKFDYQSAYRFSHYDYRSSDKQVQESIPVEQQNQSPYQENPVAEPVSADDASLALLASIKPVTTPVPSIPSDIHLSNHASNVLVASKVKEYANAPKHEKKLIRKKAKEDFKVLRQQMKEAKKDATAQDIVFNRKMFIGAIILAAGILIAILASGSVGAVTIIVGIGLMAWGLIEQV